MIVRRSPSLRNPKTILLFQVFLEASQNAAMKHLKATRTFIAPMRDRAVP